MIKLIDIMIINISSFNDFITSLGLNLVSTDSVYLLTYLFTNFLAYYIIILLFKIITRIIKTLFRRYKDV